ncbi:hypothetical protein HYT02_03095 [Candidatus Gottesmanbacteria bacterium]|nr:hypothetical protein [Candidatus Gottesmanbacteria bacterium]
MYKKQVREDHYSFKTYLPLERWISYYHQIQNIMKIKYSINKRNLKILVIGVGDNIVPKALSELGLSVKTLDLDKSLKPDYIQVLPQINISEKFDFILCSQVLEHVEFADAEKSIQKFSGICNYLIVSVPNRSISFSISIKLWFFDAKKLMLSVMNPFRFQVKKDGQHYWEIGDGIHTKNSVIDIADSSGFDCQNEYRINEFPYHHFFVFKKI